MAREDSVEGGGGGVGGGGPGGGGGGRGGGGGEEGGVESDKHEGKAGRGREKFEGFFRRRLYLLILEEYVRLFSYTTELC